VIAASNAERPLPYASQMRASAYDALVESIAVSGDAQAVIGLISERVAASRFDRCALGIASWNRLVVAALDGRGQPMDVLVRRGDLARLHDRTRRAQAGGVARGAAERPAAPGARMRGEVVDASALRG
jgi:hypothetical protein